MTPAATVEMDSYCEPVLGAKDVPWPEAGRQLLDELSRGRGCFALVASEMGASDRLVDRMAGDLELNVVRLGAALSSRDRPPTADEVEAACASVTILQDLDVLLWPALGIPVWPLLVAISRRRPVIAVWPGEITEDRARYSSPGRPDHHDARLSDVVVLRPRTTRFPDEVPYEIERIAQ